MTENEANMLWHLSPSGMAIKMAVYMGAERATKLVSFWIRGLTTAKKVQVRAIAFWADVAMRLDGLEPNPKISPMSLTAFDRTRFDSMCARAGFKKQRPR